MTDDYALRKCIVGTFEHEGNTILQVENWLKHSGFRLSRDEIRQLLSDLLLEDFWFDIRLGQVSGPISSESQ